MIHYHGPRIKGRARRSDHAVSGETAMTTHRTVTYKGHTIYRTGVTTGPGLRLSACYAMADARDADQG